MIHHLHEFVSPFTLYLNVENAQTPMRKHLDKTNTSAPRTFIFYHLSKKRVSNMFHKQLLLNDAVIGIFFLVLSIFDIFDILEILSWLYICGGKVMISLAMTLLMVLIMGVEWFLAMCFPLKNIHISVNLAWSTVIFQFFVAMTISLTAVLNLYFNNLGLNNATCVAILCIHVMDTWIVATIYVINISVTVTNLVLHVGVIRAVRNMQHNKQFSQANKA